MIPSISDIVDKLLANEIDRGQAINWLHAHAAGKANELRDQFAGQWLQGYVACPNAMDMPKKQAAIEAYEMADEMMEARGK